MERTAIFIPDKNDPVFSDKKFKVGLIIIATGNYHVFLDGVTQSALMFFMTNQDLGIYVFTDADKKYRDQRIKIIHHEHREWPYPTLFRYKTIMTQKEELAKNDYLFYCDADMKFVDKIGEEILSDRVATIHPSFLGRRGTPESIHTRSKAYVRPEEKMTYFAGGFNGGSSKEFLKMSEILETNIDSDLRGGIIAAWNDESHMNRYFLDNPPTKILDPGYCYAECYDLRYKKKIIALNKDHHNLRYGKSK